MDGEATECNLCCGCELNTDYILSQITQWKLTCRAARNRKLTLCGLCMVSYRIGVREEVGNRKQRVKHVGLAMLYWWICRLLVESDPNSSASSEKFQHSLRFVKLCFVSKWENNNNNNNNSNKNNIETPVQTIASWHPSKRILYTFFH